MKRILLYCMLPILLFGCSKGNKSTNPPPVKGNKTYSVHFDISATGSAALKTNSLHGVNDAAPVPVSTFANVLYYWVYNSSGALVTQLTQTSATSNFGQITDTFSPGSYNIVIFAQNSPGDSVLITTAPTAFHLAVPINGRDSFFDTFPLTVTDQAVSEDITLNRVVGQLQIVITDTIPATAKQITAKISPYNFIRLSNGAAVDTALNPNYFNYRTFNFPIPSSAIGKTNFTMTTYVANPPSDPFSVVLTGYNASGAAIATATINAVTTQVNTRTILSGDLFLNEATVGFTIGYAAWGSTTVVPFSKPSPIIKTN